MTDRPILFSGPMVRALLDGRKTQTRRVLKPQPEHKQVHEHRGKVIYDGEHRLWCWKHLLLDNLIDFPDGADRWALAAAMPFAPGDRLWVREAWRTTSDLDSKSPTQIERAYKDAGYVWAACPILPEADDPERTNELGLWGRLRPSIHMPRWASRLTLTVTDIKVERVQEISEEDARAEGSNPYMPGEGIVEPPRYADDHQYRPNYRTGFQVFWDAANAKRGFPWESNPWVAALTFTVEQGNIDA